MSAAMPRRANLSTTVGMRQRFFSRFLPFMALVAALGCDRLQALKSRLHASEGSSEMGCLQVEVDPQEGISILLDDQHVATRSPWRSDHVTQGAHVLEVRGMGRFAVTLPITVAAGSCVQVPVHLRIRPATPLPPAATPNQALRRADTDELAEAAVPVAALAPPPPPPPNSAKAAAAQHRRHPVPLPAGSRPLLLSVVPRPACAIWADGVAVDADNIRLAYGQGTLRIGDMQLAYQIFPGRALQLTIPHEDAAWFVGATQVKAKTLVRLAGTPVSLRRLADGVVQQALLRRIE